MARDNNDSIRCSPLRALAQFMTFKKTKAKKFLTMEASSGYSCSSAGTLANHPHDNSANYTGQ